MADDKGNVTGEPDVSDKPMPDILPDGFSIEAGWLVEQVNRHTCGAGDEYGHEPGCGSIPLAPIEVARCPKCDRGIRIPVNRMYEACSADCGWWAG